MGKLATSYKNIFAQNLGVNHSNGSQSGSQN